MTVRRYAALLLIALVALVAGCGSGDDGGGGGSDGSLGDMLGYVPKDAPVVLTVKTDPESEQYKNIEAMLGKFPFGGQLKQELKNSVKEEGVDFDQDVKPLLGNDVLVAVPGAQQLMSRTGTEDDPFLLVWTAKDADKLEETVKKRAPKEIGEVDGYKLYQGDATGQDVIGVNDGTVVAATTRQLVEEAIKRKGGDDHLAEADFNAAFKDLPGDALVKVYGNVAPLIAASPAASAARKIPFVNGLRAFGVTASAQPDGIVYDQRVGLEGVQPDQLPIAAGDEATELYRRPADFGIAIRDLTHSIRFAEQAAETTAPEEYAQYAAAKEQLAALAKVDLDKDLIEQFTGVTSVSIGADGGVGVRADLNDAAKLEDILDRASKGDFGDLKVGKPDGDGIRELQDGDGDKFYLGVVDDKLVGGTTADRAAEMATVQPVPVEGAKGAIVMGADGQELANALAERFGGEQGAAASLFTGPVGDIVGYVTANPDALRQSLKLKIE
jgi:hypothetical protein